MRIKLIVLFLLTSIGAYAQGWTIQAMPPTTTVNSKGSLYADSLVGSTPRDTVKPVWWNPAKSYNGIYHVGLDGKFYWYFGGAYHTAGGGSGSGTVTSITLLNGFVSTQNPITTSASLRLDTGRAPTQVVTGASLNKVKDSLQLNINNKVNTSDFSILFNSNLSTKTTDNLAEGSANFYFTNSRALAAINSDTGRGTNNIVTGGTLNKVRDSIVSLIGAGGVSSVSGTTNRITSTGGASPVIDISAAYVGQTSITTLGTVGTGTWQGTVISPTYGGTGVNNASRTITLGGNLVTSGAFNTTLTATATTNVTLPTTGTLATLTGTETLTNKTLTSPSISTPLITGISSGTTNDSLLVADPSTGAVRRISSSRISSGGGGGVDTSAWHKSGDATTSPRTLGTTAGSIQPILLTCNGVVLGTMYSNGTIIWGETGTSSGANSQGMGYGVTNTGSFGNPIGLFASNAAMGGIPIGNQATVNSGDTYSMVIGSKGGGSAKYQSSMPDQLTLGAAAQIRLQITAGIDEAVLTTAQGFEVNNVIKTKVYTVATLPSGVSVGTFAVVSDATAPAYLVTLVGGGAVVAGALWNGTTWVAH